MARHHGRLHKRLDLKPRAFSLFTAVTDGRPGRCRALGFFPRLGWPQGDRARVLHDSVHRFPMLLPRYAQALAFCREHNVDVIGGNVAWQDPDSNRRIVALLSDIHVPGHTLEPADPHTGTTVSFPGGGTAHWHAAHPGLGLGGARRLAGTTILVPSIANYYHQLADVFLPIVFALQVAGGELPRPLNFVIGAGQPPLVDGFRSALEALGWPTRLVALRPWQARRAEHLLFARCHTTNYDRGLATPEAISPLREGFLRVYGLDQRPRGPRRVLLTRGPSRLRQVEGIDTLQAILVRHGFVPLRGTFANHAEQMRVVADADIVVGVHGAALANIVWTGPNALLVEIMARNARKTACLNWASQVGASHAGLLGSDEGARQAFRIDPEAMAAEILALADSHLGATMTKLG